MSKPRRRSSDKEAKAPERKPRVVYASLAVALVAVTVIAYLPVLDADFLGYDDGQYVTDNLHVKRGLAINGIKWAFNIGYAGNWHPLTWISHMLDWQLYGPHPLGHHLTNLILHCANVLLLCWVLSVMTGLSTRLGTGSAWRSAFAAALFAAHPLHVESVAWIAERKDVLSTFFWLLTMLAYVSHVRSPSAPRYAFVIALFALGLTAKPMLVSLPIVLLLMDYWPLTRFMVPDYGFQAAGDRYQGTNRRHPTRDTRPVSSLLLEKLPLFVLAAASSVITLIAQIRGEAVSTIYDVGIGQRIANALVSYVLYLRDMFWPSGLACIYPWSPVAAWKGIGAGAVLAAISYAAFRLRSRPYFAFGWLWYLITLLPVIGLVQVGAQCRADRYTYIPLIGPFIIITWGAADIAGRIARDSKRLAWALGVAAVVVTICLAAATNYYARFWRDDETLFRRALAVTSRNAIAHESLATALSKRGRAREAVKHFEEALRINPNYAEAHANLGMALKSIGKIEEAGAHLLRATQLSPRNPSAHFNLAVNLGARGDIPQAISEYRKALKLDPEYVEAHVNLGALLADQGRVQAAIRHYKTAILLDPRCAMAHNNLAVALGSLGRMEEAVEHLQKAVESDPNYVEARKNLVIAYCQSGRYTDAWREMRSLRDSGVAVPPEFVEKLRKKLNSGER